MRRSSARAFPARKNSRCLLGDYLFRLGVRDNTTGTIGTADAKVSVLFGPPQKTKE